MDTSTLRTFLTLARMGHMTRAAAELHLTQPAVSAQLHKLEEGLGHRLFDRTPKGMVLTRAGEVWRQHVEECLAKLQDGERALAELEGLERGALTLGGGATATTYLLPPLLGKFHATYPNIQLFVREQGSQSVLTSVMNGELELGIVTLPVAAQTNLHIEPWVEDELRLIVPQGHALDGEKTFRWEQLDAEPLVLFEAGSAVRRILDHSMAAAGIRTEIVMELRSIESIKQMVHQGIGAAFVSRFALTSPERGLVCEQESLSRQLGLIWRTDRTMSAAATVFIESCTRPRAPLP